MTDHMWPYQNCWVTWMIPYSKVGNNDFLYFQCMEPAANFVCLEKRISELFLSFLNVTKGCIFFTCTFWTET